ncbi:hypothetical protein BJX65DRAFT_315484 [Aspergillus insuetus]
MSLSAAAAAAAALSARTPALNEIPTTAATCIISVYINNNKNNSPVSALELVESCCGTADAVSYFDCDYHITAQGQTVSSLADCLIKGSSSGSGSEAREGIVQVWCDNANEDVDTSAPPDGGMTISATIAVATDSSTEGASTTPTKEKRGEAELEEERLIGTGAELETILKGGGLAQGNSVGVTTAILLVLMAFGGAVRPVP